MVDQSRYKKKLILVEIFIQILLNSGRWKTIWRTFRSRILLGTFDRSGGSSTVDGSIPSSIALRGVFQDYSFSNTAGGRRLARRGRSHDVIGDFRFRPDSNPRLALWLAT